MKLIKCSEPGWEKEFNDINELRAELLLHICGGCMLGDPEYEIDAISEDASIDAILATACGCEFYVED